MIQPRVHKINQAYDILKGYLRNEAPNITTVGLALICDELGLYREENELLVGKIFSSREILVKEHDVHKDLMMFTLCSTPLSLVNKGQI